MGQETPRSSVDDVWAVLQAASHKSAKFESVWGSVIAGGAKGKPSATPLAGNAAAKNLTASTAAAQQPLKLQQRPQQQQQAVVPAYAKPAADASRMSVQDLAAALQPEVFALRDEAPGKRRVALERMLSYVEVRPCAGPQILFSPGDRPLPMV